MKNDVIKLIGRVALGLFICLLTGTLREGTIFVLTAFFVSFPRTPVCRWYDTALGALGASVTALLAGDGGLVFWGLFAVAAAALSLKSIFKTVLLAAAALLLLKLDAGAAVYAALFIGIIWNAILAFTYSEIYGTIKSKG